MARHGTSPGKILRDPFFQSIQELPSLGDEDFEDWPESREVSEILTTTGALRGTPTGVTFSTC